MYTLEDNLGSLQDTFYEERDCVWSEFIGQGSSEKQEKISKSLNLFLYISDLQIDTLKK